METSTTDSLRRIVAVAWIALALCAATANLVRITSRLEQHSLTTFTAANTGVRFPALESQLGRMDLEKSWRPRVLSLELAGLATRGAIRADGQLDLPKLAVRIGLYTGAWLALTFAVYLAFLGGDALLPILGTWAAVTWGYTPGIGDRVYPWDLPPVFFFALFVCLMLRGRAAWFLPVMPVAILFKETAAVLSLAYLLLPDVPARRRLQLFGAALSLAIVTKVAADLATDASGRFGFEPRLLLANLSVLAGGAFPQPDWYPTVSRLHPLLLNAGLLVAFALVPFRSGWARPLRAVVAAFALCTALFAVIFEYRVWFELAPILLVPLIDAVHAVRRVPAA